MISHRFFLSPFTDISKIESTITSSMEVLNPDCLTSIFLHLDFLERVKLEQVCQLWYYVLQQQSCYSDMRILNIADFLLSTTTEYYQQESISFAPTALGVVERCGRYVQELTFGHRWLKISQPIINCIADNCYRLRVVDLGSVILNADISCLLERICGHLEDFSLADTSWVNINCAAKVQDFFPRMKKLKRLNMRAAMFELDRLDELPVSLQFLEISGAHRFPPENLSRFLRTHRHLTELYMSPIPVISQEIVDELSRLSDLQHFSIGYTDAEINYDVLSSLTSLRSLTLQNISGITEMSLRQLLERMTLLEELTIEKCRNILDYTSLGVCANLHTLIIKDTMQLANEDIFTLCTYGRLKTLKLTNCFNLTTRGVTIALMRCQLRELTVNKCSGVTDEMMYTLASTQRELEHISIQGCAAVTSKGVSALAWLRNVALLREVDVSRNRNVDDTVVLSLHNALTMAYRTVYANYAYDKQSQQQTDHADDMNKLIMYTFETSVSREVGERVKDLIILS